MSRGPVPSYPLRYRAPVVVLCENTVLCDEYNPLHEPSATAYTPATKPRWVGGVMLIHCPECAGEVSEKAVACPKCGHPILSVESLSEALSQQTCPRPEQVATAVMLIYVSCGLSLLANILYIASGALYYGAVDTYIAHVIGGLVFTIFIAYVISIGRNWARITYLLISIFGILFAIPSFGQVFSYSVFSGLLGVANWVLNFIALVLLFQGPSSYWFRFKSVG